MKQLFLWILKKRGFHLKKTKQEADQYSDYFGISIQPEVHDYMIRAKPFVKKLINDYGASLSLDKASQKIQLHVSGLHFNINTWEEVNIIYEIFNDGIYNYKPGGSYVLVDIGMNIGVTSLSHSIREECKKIYSFEPFEETLATAAKNYELNPSSKKITVNEFGLGYPKRSMEVKYSHKYKGSVGIEGLAHYVESDADNIQIATLKIEDVHEVLEKIVNDNPNEKIVVKLDAEGVEYEILERLSATGLLPRFNFFMIEWHLKGPLELEATLIKNGFSVFSMWPSSKQIGMLYAFKKDK